MNFCLSTSSSLLVKYGSVHKSECSSGEWLRGIHKSKGSRMVVPHFEACLGPTMPYKFRIRFLVCLHGVRWGHQIAPILAPGNTTPWVCPACPEIQIHKYTNTNTQIHKKIGTRQHNNLGVPSLLTVVTVASGII